MMCRALFSRFRSPSHFRPFPQSRSFLKPPSFARSAGRLFSSDLEPFEEKIICTVKQILKLVRTRAITSQDAVQRITSFTKNKPQRERELICPWLWTKSFEAARVSADSAVPIAEFLSELSCESQEDYEDWPKGTEPEPIMVQTEYGQQEELWDNMPGMWDELTDLRTEGLPRGSDRKAGIDRVLKDRRFISTLFLTSSPLFEDLLYELLLPFKHVTTWPPVYDSQREDQDIWLPALVVQLETAGAELKDAVLRNGPYNGNWYGLGWWLRMQRRLLAMTADETIDAELRATAKQVHDMMTIERTLTNRWYHKWRHALLEIAGDRYEHFDDRVTAKRTTDILRAEDAKIRGYVKTTYYDPRA